MKKIYLIMVLGCLFCYVRAGTESSSKIKLTVNYTAILTGMDENQPEGIVAKIQPGGYVQVKVRVYSADGNVINTPIYQCESRTNSKTQEDYIANEISGGTISYQYPLNGFLIHIKSGKDIKGRLQHSLPTQPSGSESFASTNYPHTLMNDVYSNGLKFALIPSSNYVIHKNKQYYDNSHLVELEIITKDALAYKIGIPGIGIIRPFNVNHPCTTATANDDVCGCLQTMKNSGNKDVPDVIPAAHRGIWGGNDQGGPPENSAESIRQTKSCGVDIVEVDIMMTKDKKLICLHDYNLDRLTNGTGYTYDKTFSELQKLNLKKRDGSLTNKKILEFSQLLDIVKSEKLVLMIDIKELQAKMEGGVCVANCEYQTVEKQQASWFEILSLCLTTIDAKDACKNVIFKTYYTPSILFSHYPLSKREKMLLTPMVISKNFDNNIQQICQFIENWVQSAGNLIAYFETDFFDGEDVQLKSFTRDGKTYVNILHFLQSLGYRGGIFSEEPVGSRGVVNRWGEWKMKKPETDFRADYLKLMEIPYADKMVITTDRTDIWKRIMELQK